MVIGLAEGFGWKRCLEERVGLSEDNQRELRVQLASLLSHVDWGGGHRGGGDYARGGFRVRQCSLDPSCPSCREQHANFNRLRNARGGCLGRGGEEGRQ